MSDEERGLICAYVLDGKGGGRTLDYDGLAQEWNAGHRPGGGPVWVHLDFRDPTAQAWVRENVPDPQAVETLLADETRPRSVATGDALLVTLRGVNLNPGSDPEDMVSIRFWIGADRIVSTRHRRIMAINDAREALAAGQGPREAGDILVFTADSLMRRMGPTLDTLADTVDGLEALLLEDDTNPAPQKSSSADLRRKLGNMRRETIELRRYLAPQREAMTRLMGETVAWLSARHRAKLREVADHITRYVEDLDALRDRAAVVQDELRNRISEDMNRTMYVLTVVASVLLPLSLLTGLLGINVDGMPGAQNTPHAFWLVTGGLVVIGAVQIWLFRKLRWL